MISLDSGVLIALLDGADEHHDAAVGLFRRHLDEPMTIGPINLAEVLVRAAGAGRDDEVVAAIDALGIVTTPLPADAAVRLARLRARTSATMPDCCVLLTTQQTSARLASFDARLLAGAEKLGIATVASPPTGH